MFYEAIIPQGLSYFTPTDHIPYCLYCVRYEAKPLKLQYKTTKDNKMMEAQRTDIKVCMFHGSYHPALWSTLEHVPCS